jgi:hypothetical protein
MKKIILLAVLVTIGFGTALFAQQSKPRYKESEYYYFNVPIEKIYIYRKGYIVNYRKGANQLARVYIPGDWFTDIGGKGELIGLGSGKEWPSMTVYYKNGEFSHVRLRVRREKSHVSWGVVPLNINIDEDFESIEDLQLQF